MADLDQGVPVPKQQQPVLVIAAMTMETMTQVTIVDINIAMDKTVMKIEWWMMQSGLMDKRFISRMILPRCGPI